MKARPLLIGGGAVLLLVVAAWLALLAPEPGEAPRPAVAAAPPMRPPGGSAAPPELRPRDCWVRLSDVDAECGTVEVPLEPGTRAVARLAVLRVRGSGPPGVAPLLFLGGGPGHPVIARLTRSLRPLLELSRERDLVFVDPRGTGHSTPSLECHESGPLPDSLHECFETHSVEIDPSSFTTAAGVRDLEQVRRALGYQRWDVLATSYGTRWALTLLRDAPESVRAVVLDSPVPLQVDLVAQLATNAHRALLEVFAACAAQAECGGHYPDLPADLTGVVAALATAPVASARGAIDADRFVRVVFGLLYSPVTAVYVPQVVHGAAGGDFGLFLELEQGFRTNDFSLGAHLSVQCAEEAPFTSAEAVGRADAAVPLELRSILSGKSYLEDCGVWRVRAAPPLENDAVRSAAPALVLSGRLDPVTPPEYAALIHADLPASRLVIVQGASHGLALSPCGLRLADAFLRAPEAPLELSCLVAAAPVPIAPPRGKVEVGTPLVFRIDPPTADELATVLDAL